LQQLGPASQCVSDVCLIALLQFGAVTSVDFCPEYPYNFAVTASTRVSLGCGSSAVLAAVTLTGTLWQLQCVDSMKADSTVTPPAVATTAAAAAAALAADTSGQEYGQS
jgi:hypothetical protein